VALLRWDAYEQQKLPQHAVDGGAQQKVPQGKNAGSPQQVVPAHPLAGGVQGVPAHVVTRSAHTALKQLPEQHALLWVQLLPFACKP